MNRLLTATILGITTCLSSVAWADSPIEKQHPSVFVEDETPTTTTVSTHVSTVSPVVQVLNSGGPSVHVPVKEDHSTPMPDPIRQPRYKWIGMIMDIGVPDGAALGIVLRPLFFTRFEFVGTYNGLAPGMRAGLVLDPIKFPMVPILAVEGGYSFSGNVPFMNNPPSAEYGYVNLHTGLEFGSRDSARFFIHGGVSYIDMQGHNFGSAFSNSNGVAVGDPSIRAWVAPSLKLGFFVLF